MESVEAAGKTLDEAKRTALQQLGVGEQEVKFEVLKRPGAVAGLFRSGEYCVRATLRAETDEQPDEDTAAEPVEAEAVEEEAAPDAQTDAEPAPEEVMAQAAPEQTEPLSEDREAVLNEIAAKAKEVAADVIRLMGMDDVSVEVTGVEDQEIGLEMSCDQPALLIGRDGETLDALQLVVAIAANKGRPDGARVVLDAEDYRERTTHKLEDLARSYAAEAKENEQEVVLPDLRPYERRIIHMTLRDDPDVETYSEGEGRHRVLVISPRK